ncbi:MAG: peptidylprolyl isomerase [Pseudomonadales bacterium]
MMQVKPRTNGGTIGRTFGLLRVALAGLLIAFASTAAQAAYEELDAVVAVVDDDVVLASELLSRLETVKKQMAGANVQPPPEDILLSQLMERLVVESIQLQQATRRGVDIDDETLTRAVRGFAQQNNMDLDTFRAALVRDGMSYREFREEIRREMIISRLQRNMVNRRISISDQEIDAVLNSPFYQQVLSDEFRVGHILLTIEESASEAAEQAAEQAAQTIVTELRSGADFAQMAISRSSGSRALEGGDLGWRRAAELPSLFAETVLELSPGDVAEPIRSSSGIHVVKLLEQRGAGMQKEEQTKARHILVRPSEIRTEAQTLRMIQDLHQQVLDGADFGELAKEHSEDPGSALNGGDLGWSTGEQFVEKFREALLTTDKGKVSAPFRSTYGWHILEVEDRRIADLSDETRRNMVVQLLHKRRFNEELEEWLKEIRDEAFVEVRL